MEHLINKTNDKNRSCSFYPKKSATTKKEYKLLLPLAFLLLTVCLSSVVLAYKITEIHGVIISTVAFIIPFRYMLSDIIAEIYGLSIAKKIIWLMVISGFIFSLICVASIKLPSPAFWAHQSAYEFVLGQTFRVTFSAGFGVIVGSMLNVYLLSKWKVLLKGKYFLFRSFGASVIGELTQYIFTLTILFFTVFSYKKIFDLIVADYGTQFILLLIISPFAQLVIFLVKYIERNNM